MFAKLYETEIGQILVKRDEGDDGPEMRLFFKPEKLGVCSFAFSYSDDDEGWDKLDKAFDDMNEKDATEMTKNIFSNVTQKTFE